MNFFMAEDWWIFRECLARGKKVIFKYFQIMYYKYMKNTLKI